MKRIIVAINKNNGIGINNKLAWHLPEDLRWFKHLTQKTTIVMGRNTFDSLGRPLPDRTNVVISRTLQPFDNVIVCRSLEEAFEKFPTCFVIGGEQIYRQAIGMVDEMIITHVDNDVECDAFFPEIGSEWRSDIIRYFSNNNYVRKYQRLS